MFHYVLKRWNERFYIYANEHGILWHQQYHRWNMANDSSFNDLKNDKQFSPNRLKTKNMVFLNFAYAALVYWIFRYQKRLIKFGEKQKNVCIVLSETKPLLYYHCTNILWEILLYKYVREKECSKPKRLPVPWTYILYANRLRCAKQTL